MLDTAESSGVPQAGRSSPLVICRDVAISLRGLCRGFPPRPVRRRLCAVSLDGLINMCCNRLAEPFLPSAAKTGLPWTDRMVASPPAQSDGSDWPRVLILTPSYTLRAKISRRRSAPPTAGAIPTYIGIDNGLDLQSPLMRGSRCRFA